MNSKRFCDRPLGPMMLVFGLIPGMGLALAGLKSQAVEPNPPTQSTPQPRFGFCKSQCKTSRYYTGYNQTNGVKLGNQSMVTPEMSDRIFPSFASVNMRWDWPKVDQKNLGGRDGNFVSSTYRIEKLRIGYVEKTELMQISALQDDASVSASVRLLWGDTLRISSQTLEPGTTVRLKLKRSMGGFADTVTDQAHYQVKSQTYINGEAVPALSFSVAKLEPTEIEPSLNPIKTEIPTVAEQIWGEGESTHAFEVKVGESFTIEAVLEVMDGVEGTRLVPQVLKGGDSVQYQIVLAENSVDQACLTSASGIFKSGRCH